MCHFKDLFSIQAMLEINTSKAGVQLDSFVLHLRGVHNRHEILEAVIKIFSYLGYSNYLCKFKEITITCFASLDITRLKSQRNFEMLLKSLKSLKSWRRFSSVAGPS